MLLEILLRKNHGYNFLKIDSEREITYEWSTSRLLRLFFPEIFKCLHSYVINVSKIKMAFFLAWTKKGALQRSNHLK